MAPWLRRAAATPSVAARMAKDARVELLRTVHLFSGCTDKQLEFIATQVEDVDVAADRYARFQASSRSPIGSGAPGTIQMWIICAVKGRSKVPIGHVPSGLSTPARPGGVSEMQMCSCACQTVSGPPTVGPGSPIFGM